MVLSIENLEQIAHRVARTDATLSHLSIVNEMGDVTLKWSIAN